MPSTNPTEKPLSKPVQRLLWHVCALASHTVCTSGSDTRSRSIVYGKTNPSFRLTSELSEMFKRSHELEAEIREKLGVLGYEF